MKALCQFKPLPAASSLLNIKTNYITAHREIPFHTHDKDSPDKVDCQKLVELAEALRDLVIRL